MKSKRPTRASNAKAAGRKKKPKPRKPARPKRPTPRPLKRKGHGGKHHHGTTKHSDKSADDGPSSNGSSCGTLGINDGIFQEQVNWCWAACVEVAVRFRSNQNAQIRQCDVATAALGAAANCCGLRPTECLSARGGASSGPCDVPQNNSQITTLLQSFGINATEDGKLTEAILRSELSTPNPKLVGVHIAWNNVSGHMVLVYGCAGDTRFNVYDPCLGPQTLTYNQLVNYSDGEGAWDLSWRGL